MKKEKLSKMSGFEDTDQYEKIEESKEDLKEIKDMLREVISR